MREYYMNATTSKGTLLCLSTLTRRVIEMLQDEIDDVSGHFLYEIDNSSNFPRARILARIPDDQAALEMGDMLGLT